MGRLACRGRGAAAQVARRAAAPARRASSGSGSAPRSLPGVAAYEAALAANPVLTKCATGGVLAFLGDIVAQRAQRAPADGDEPQPMLDARRLTAFTVFGVGWTGLFNHYWFGWLASVIPGASLWAVGAKTAVQHGFCNPVLYLPLFYAFNGAWTGLSFPQIRSKAEAEYWPTLTKLWTIWVPSTAIQFFLVPTRLQVLYVAGVSFGWNVRSTAPHSPTNMQTNVAALS